MTKTYRLGSERTNWRSLIPGRLGEPASKGSFHALEDVSLELRPGESLGVLGPNGAGKSTLLKVLAGIVKPTTGTVSASGRVLSIIELGLGFNADLTGAENIRFAGSLFGATSREIDILYPDIVEFSELHGFMDMPVKRYSTGMKARLGFALVTSLESDLVIIDEVLSVGDWHFQKKSAARIKEINNRGTALVAVSHNNWMITQLCDRAILLDKGRIALEGEPLDVVQAYIGEGTNLDPDKDTDFPLAPTVTRVVGSTDEEDAVELRDLQIRPRNIKPFDRLQFEVTVVVKRPVDAELAMSVYTMGRAAFADPDLGPSEILRQPGVWKVRGLTEPLPFAAGAMYLRIVVTKEIDPEDFRHEHLAAIASVSGAFRIDGPTSTRPGLLFNTQWTVSRDQLHGS
ncbi:MAG: ABC transporter ATP-binding protein [Microthrixaceae bacterium]